MKKTFFTLLSAAIVAGAYFGMNLIFEEDEVEGGFERPEMPVRVEAVDVRRMDMEETLTYPGSVTASESVAITPKVTGSITNIRVEMGDFVETGTPLVEIDDSEYVERLKQSQANLKLSEARLRLTESSYNLAKREYERATNSERQGLNTQRELDSATATLESARAEMDVAKAEVERVRAAVEEAELNVRYTKIASPVSGWVQARNLDPGALASPSTEILTLVDTDPAEVVVYLPEREISLANTGLKAVIDVGNGAMLFEGTVTRVAPSLRTNTRTAEVVIDVPNPDTRLRPGMSADVTLVARTAPNTLVLPESAFVYQNGRTEVYRIQDGKAFAVPVETGIAQDDMRQVISGVSEGDRIVTKGQFMLREGQIVNDGTTPMPEMPKRPGKDS